MAAARGGDGGGSDLERSLLAGGDREALQRLTSADNGLQLRKWLVADRPAVIAAALARHGVEALPDPAWTRQLQRNGLRMVRVPAGDLDGLLRDLGGASVNVEGWHGQIVSWRALHELPVPGGSAVLAVDGRVRRFDGGGLALVARCWTMPMEDGPRLQLELAAEYRAEPRRSDFDQLLGRQDPGRQRFESLSFEVELEPGFAYVLTYAAPGDRWPMGAGEAGDAAAAPGVGPDVAPPATIGRCLLAGRGGRGMLVFVPRISPALMPPASPAGAAYRSSEPAGAPTE